MPKNVTSVPRFALKLRHVEHVALGAPAAVDELVHMEDAHATELPSRLGTHVLRVHHIASSGGTGFAVPQQFRQSRGHCLGLRGRLGQGTADGGRRCGEMGGPCETTCQCDRCQDVRRAVTWKPKKAGDRVIDIAEVISPLRYDVLVRAQFFASSGEARRGAQPRGLVAAATTEPYAVWFREVAMARFRPWVLEDPDLLGRLRRAGALQSRTAALVPGPGLRPLQPRDPAGDLRRPAQRHRGPDPRDGPRRRRGHRLALLLRAGSALEPSMYRLDPRPMPLISNTAVLHRALGLQRRAYLAFIARAYTPVRCRT